MQPQLIFTNRQRTLPVDLAWIRSVVEFALPLCMDRPRKSGCRLPPVVEITLLGEKAITRVHGEFLDDPTPTDVITFDHGEILVCVSVAASNARKLGHSQDREIALCVVHGLLHLLGYDDLTPDERSEMHARQEEILKEACRMT